jgi:hypothetical protein
MGKVKIGALTFTRNDAEDGYIVSGCDKDIEEMVIPKKVEGLPVRGIGENAFEDCEKLRLVILPENDVDSFINGETFQEIGEYAFSGCLALENIVIPEGVWTVARGAFYGCRALKTVEMPEDVYVGSYAFCHCENLKEITKIRHASEGAFSHCKSLEVFPVSSGVQEISEDAFEHCYALKEIVIPASVKSIEALAFRSCYGLQRVVFENPNGWFVEFRYMGQEERALDVSDPLKNAEMLSRQDFDDGVIAGYRK